MAKLMVLSKLSEVPKRLKFLGGTSVVVDKRNVPVGFVFGREAFISLLEMIDGEFEKKVENPLLAHDNPAGQLIDLIEGSLPINPRFASQLKVSIKSQKADEGIAFEDVVKSLHV